MYSKPQDIIRKKRDGKRLSAEDIVQFIDGVCDRSWADYQVTALLMAMFVNGLDPEEQDALTRSMLHSGEIMDLADIDMPKADKHSTGGVGDKTSLIIAPVLASCGVAVPMISGRGLGHTGGTLDKLEAIPGYNVRLTLRQVKKTIRDCGFALAGQTARIAPADRKLYALRDATATVPYIPLIVASIMSKKLAEGLDALVLDVKTGSGAFIQDLAGSKRLAEALCKTGRNFGVLTEALVTDMSEPLGLFVGNALETYECIKILRSEAAPQMSATLDLSVELSANVLVQCAIESSLPAARKRVRSAIADGSALERFARNIELQGGDPAICEKPEKLRTKLKAIPITASAAGFVELTDPRTIGECVSAIGGGRVKASDSIDHAVGFECTAKVGTEVAKGDVLGVLYARNESTARRVTANLEKAYTISPIKPRQRTLVRAKV